MTDKPNAQLIQQLHRQGTLALQRGETERAVELLRQAHRLAPRDVDVRLNLSSAFILQKRFKEAVPLLEELTAEHPHNPRFWLNLGAAYLGNPILANDEEQLRAIGAFKKALEIDPHTPNAAYNLGLVHRDRQEYRQALQHFKQAAASAPDDADAQHYVAKMREKLADDDHSAGS